MEKWSDFIMKSIWNFANRTVGVPIALEKSSKFTSSSIHGKIIDFYYKYLKCIRIKKVMEYAVHFGWMMMERSFYYESDAGLNKKYT